MRKGWPSMTVTYQDQEKKISEKSTHASAEYQCRTFECIWRVCKHVFIPVNTNQFARVLIESNDMMKQLICNLKDKSLIF